MSDTGTRVHDAHTTAWRPLDLLATARQAAPFHGASVLARTPKHFAQRALTHHQAHPSGSAATPALEAPAGQPGQAQASEDTTPPALPGAQWEQAFEAGRAQGRAEALQAWQAEQAQHQAQAEQSHSQALHTLWANIDAAVQTLVSDAQARHEPLKRLALHLAEELVLGELQLQPQAIDRLVQRCLDTLDARTSEQVLIELHPQDLARLQADPSAQADRPPRWQWLANEQLLPGSVRVRLNDTLVDDLIDHRLQALAAQLLAQPQAWVARSALRPSALAERQRQALPVEDALPRTPSPNTPLPESPTTENASAENPSSDNAMPAQDAPPDPGPPAAKPPPEDPA